MTVDELIEKYTGTGNEPQVRYFVLPIQENVEYIYVLDKNENTITMYLGVNGELDTAYNSDEIWKLEKAITINSTATVTSGIYEGTSGNYTLVTNSPVELEFVGEDIGLCVIINNNLYTLNYDENEGKYIVTSGPCQEDPTVPTRYF